MARYTLSLSEKIARLPKWAQDHIRRLEADVQQHAGQIEHLLGMDPRPAIMVRGFWTTHTERQAPVAWDRFDTITIFLGESGDDRKYIDVSRNEDGTVNVRGDSKLVITPNVSNSVDIGTNGR